MRRNNIVLSIITLVILIMSCNASGHLKKLENQKEIDKRLVGTWEGSEKGNQIAGMTKEWKMIRTDNGRFTLHFKATMNEHSQEFTEDGNWWVSNGVFYEYHDVSGKTDKYTYEMLSKDRIKFKAISLGLDHENQNYEFEDNRVK